MDPEKDLKPTPFKREIQYDCGCIRHYEEIPSSNPVNPEWENTAQTFCPYAKVVHRQGKRSTSKRYIPGDFWVIEALPYAMMLQHHRQKQESREVIYAGT